MSEHHPEHEVTRDAAGSDDLGSLTVEDEPAGTVDPADLAGTAGPDDHAAGPGGGTEGRSAGSGSSA